MNLVDSVRNAQASVSTAFDQLVSDIEADEAAENGTAPSVEKITVTYSDGSSADFAPPSEVAGGVEDDTEVKDLTDETPKSNGETQAAPTDPTPPGNAEQV